VLKNLSDHSDCAFRQWVTRYVQGSEIHVFTGVFVLVPLDDHFRYIAGVIGSSQLNELFANGKITTSKVNHIRLPAGSYTLGSRFLTLGLKGPKPVSIGVFCHPSGRSVGSLALEANENNTPMERNVVFDVPSKDCGLQTLRIFNDNFDGSWSNRYSGSLLIDRILIELNAS